MNLPAFVLACPATLALIIAALRGDLPRVSLYDAWEALPYPDSYTPSEEVEEWLRSHWWAVVGGGLQECNESVKSEASFDKNLETLDLAREWSRSWMPALIMAYLEAGGVMTEACRAVNRSDETVRLWRHRDPVFRAALEAVERQRNDRIRAVIHNHAIEGVEEPVIGSVGDYRDGQLTGLDGKPLFVRKFDHRLLLRYAEAHLPEYQRKTDGATTVNVSASASASASATATTKVSKEDLAARQARTRKKLKHQVDRLQLDGAVDGNN